MPALAPPWVRRHSTFPWTNRSRTSSIRELTSMPGWLASCPRNMAPTSDWSSTCCATSSALWRHLHAPIVSHVPPPNHQSLRPAHQAGSRKPASSNPSEAATVPRLWSLDRLTCIYECRKDFYEKIPISSEIEEARGIQYRCECIETACLEQGKFTYDLS